MSHISGAKILNETDKTRTQNAPLASNYTATSAIVWQGDHTANAEVAEVVDLPSGNEHEQNILPLKGIKL